MNFAPEMEDEEIEKLHQERQQELDQGLMNDLNPNVKSLLENQGLLEDKYNFFFIKKTIMEEKEEKLDEGEEEEEQEENLDWKRSKIKCTRDLEKNTKNLVRALLESEHDFLIVKQLRESPNTNYTELIKNLKSLRVIMLKKLGTAMEEEKNHSLLLKALKTRISDKEEEKEKHKKQFENLRQIKEQKSQEQIDQINKLKAQIATIEKETKQFIENLKAKDEARKTEQELKLKEDKEKLSKNLDSANDKFLKKKEESLKFEEHKKQKLKSLQSRIDLVINAYDEEMKELTEKKFKLDNELQKCIEELKQLEKDNANTELDKQRKAKIEAKW